MSDRIECNTRPSALTAGFNPLEWIDNLFYYVGLETPRLIVDKDSALFSTWDDGPELWVNDRSDSATKQRALKVLGTCKGSSAASTSAIEGLKAKLQTGK